VDILRLHPSLRRPGWSDLAALAGGGVLPLAFAPLGFFPLAVLAPALLFVLWAGASPGRAAWRGFLFGLGQFGVGVGWLYIALHEFGDMHGLLAFPLLLLFIAFLAGYPALLGWLQARLRGTGGTRQAPASAPGWTAPALLPALWVLLEWVRGWFLTGFPWLDLGYSQIDGPLAGYAPLLGVYGLSLAAVISAALLVQMVYDRGRAGRYLGVLLLLWSGGWVLGQLSWVEPEGKPLRTALVQGNVALDKKWSTQYRSEIVQRYSRLTLEQQDVDVVVWPEAALPATRDELQEGFIQQLEQQAAQRRMELLIGVLEREVIDGRRTYYNSVLSIGPHPGVYRKHHLVPFGEFLPLSALLRWLPDYLYIPMSDFSPGPARQDGLQVAGRTAGISICYEDAFGEQVRRSLPEATFLVNVSEDAWYGDSWAPHQHQQMARMRALENGRPMLRATNTGITAIIDHRGAELARAPQFVVTVLTGQIQPMQGVTPFVRFGNVPVIVCALLVPGVMLLRVLRGSKLNAMNNVP
jgi:apolipoprotein N-acyltransferase